MSGQFTHGYALLIGVGESAYPEWSLEATVRDAKAIRAMPTCGTRVATNSARKLIIRRVVVSYGE